MLDLKSIVPNLAKVAKDPIKIKAFKAANEAMAELFTAGFIGNTCVRQKFLTASMVQSLSKTCFTILLPMFLFTSIMKTIQGNGGRLTSSTIMIPIIAITHCFIVNLIARYCLLPLFDMDDTSDEGRSTLVCCTFGNSGVIPLIFAEALFRHNSYVLQKAYSFVSLYLVGWSPLFWSFGRTCLLGRDDDNNNNNSNERKDTKEEDGDIGLPKVSMMTMMYEQMKYMKSLFPPPVIGVLTGLFISSIPILRNLFMMDPSINDSNNNKPILGVIYNCFQNLGRAANPLALLVLTSSLALGSSSRTSTNTEKVKRAQIPFAPSGPKVIDHGYKKSFVTTFLSSSSSLSLSDGAGGDDDSHVPLLHRLSCVSIARFLISPTLMMMLLSKTIGPLSNSNNISSSSSGSSSTISDHSMIWFILMLQSCMPPAQNSVLMLQVAEKTKEATTLAKFLFSIYTLAMIPIILISTILLEQCGLTQA